jgi:mono/diheme cytochrome c family protein
MLDLRLLVVAALPAAIALFSRSDVPSHAPPVLLSEPRSGESKDDGAALYQRCVACHQATGEGVPGAFPPLAGSEFVTGKPAVPIRILLHGLTGPVKVKGTDYNGIMMPYGTGQPMSDSEAAAVLTYIRTNFGNKAAPITARQVATERAATKARTTPFTEAELRALLK